MQLTDRPVAACHGDATQTDAFLEKDGWPSPCRRSPVPPGFRGAPSRIEVAAGRMFATLVLWQERGRQRRALGQLDPALLREIGRTREEAACECAKPVWRA
jgi:uncharacterized protein YjiS (DUF1127 family)